MKKLNSNGFSATEALLIVLVLGLIGGAGWLVYDRQKDKTSSTSSQAQSSSDSEGPKVPEGVKYSVPAGWQVADGPFADSKKGEGNHFLSPDYKEAGGGQLSIVTGASITFYDTDWVEIKSDTSLEQAVDVLKAIEVGYFDQDSVKITTVSGKKVIMYDSGHTTDGVTVLHKTAAKRWLTAAFSTTTGGDGNLNAQDSPHYQTFTTWLEEFIELNP